MVENQWGSSDITQSMDMKVTVKPQKSNPGPASAPILPWATRGAFVLFLATSC